MSIDASPGPTPGTRSRPTRRSSSRRRAVGRSLGLAASLVPKRADLAVVYGLPRSEDGATAVQRALVDRGHRVVRLVDALPEAGHQQAGVEYLTKTSAAGFRAFSQASLVFTSHVLYAQMPLVRAQRRILLWHGEVVKPVGLLDGDDPVEAHLAPVCSELGRLIRAAEFGIHSSRIPVLGAPRNDRLLTADRSEIRGRLGWAVERPIWLWLPTYRVAVRGGRRSDTATSANGLPFDAGALSRLDAGLHALGVDLVLKAHPLSEQQPGDRTNLRSLTQDTLDALDLSLYEVLAAADGLVTDVSSVWVDYLLVRRPVVFAFPDLAEYQDRRGLNLQPYQDWLPGPLARSVDDLLAAIEAAQRGDPETTPSEHHRRRFHRHRDAHSTRRLLAELGL